MQKRESIDYKIRGTYASPRKSEKKVADYVLANARKIVLCGVENSSAAAKDLMTKLLYLGYDCRFDEDYYIQHISAAALTEKDVMVGISYSGQSKDTVDIMKAAKKAGAQTICITNKNSKIIRDRAYD